MKEFDIVRVTRHWKFSSEIETSLSVFTVVGFVDIVLQETEISNTKTMRDALH